MGIGILIVVLVVVAVVWFISVQNRIRVCQLKVKEALAGIDVALTKRYDTLTKMLDAVKMFQKHEEELLMSVIRMRSGMSMQERQEANAQMDRVASGIQVLAENYPEIKSSNNYIELQKSIADVEEHLQAARRLYNANVTAYNAKIVVFPNSIVASVMGAQMEEYFQAEEVKHQDVKIG